MASVGIAGSARVEGAARTHGAPGTAGIVNGDTKQIQRVVIFWVGAVGILFLFHVGGARLG